MANYAFEVSQTSAYAPEILEGLSSADRRDDAASAPFRAESDLSTGLALEDINLSFGGVVALAGVDLSIEAGEIRAIIGPNGAGKSSLINVISGVYRPQCGHVVLNGVRYAQVPTQKLAHLGVARTFQNLALFKGLSVLDNVVAGRAHTVRSSFAGQIAGTPLSRRERRDSHDRATQILDFLHLGGVRDRLAGMLPYGLQKRVELARALVAEPRLLLLDEPMAGMTATEKSEMATFVRAARDRFGMTVVLIEHDVGVVMELSDRIAVLDYGRKIADATPAEIRSDQRVIDAYLGVVSENEDGGGI